MFTIQTVTQTHYFILTLALVAWCSLHSLMITPWVINHLENQLKEKFRFYRLFFNLVALVTLIPVGIFAFMLHTEPLFSWDGNWLIVQGLLLGLALILFILGSRRYDSRQFLGIAQIQDGPKGKGLTASGNLNTAGILNVIRHPWYTGGILLIWARPLDISAIVVNTVFTAYFIIGSYLEEKKLVNEFGDGYRAYQQRVSMLFPYKWLGLKITKWRIK